MLINIDEKIASSSLREARKKLDSAGGELTLDFSSVCRVDAVTLFELGNLARIAGEKSVKVVLRGANVDVYKVLKLTKLTQKFSFAN